MPVILALEGAAGAMVYRARHRWLVTPAGLGGQSGHDNRTRRVYGCCAGEMVWVDGVFDRLVAWCVDVVTAGKTKG
jgi:hypothetical protein